MAIASLIINAYNRPSALTAQNADVAPTTLGVAYLRFMKMSKTDTCALYLHHKHICAWQKNLIFHKSLVCRGQTLNLVECDPGPQVQNLSVVFVVRKCGSGDGLNEVSACR